MATGKMKMSYMGPKDPVTGERPDEPPPYVHQSVPCWLYHPDYPGWPREGKFFTTSDSAAEALSQGWVDNPGKLGAITEPSPEQREAIRLAGLDQVKADADAEAARRAEEQELIAEARAAREAAKSKGKGKADA